MSPRSYTFRLTTRSVSAAIATGLVVAALIGSALPATANATWTPPQRRSLGFKSRGYGVPLYTVASRPGYLGAYAVAPKGWMPLAYSPKSTRANAAELRRLRTTWKPATVKYDGKYYANPVTVAELALGDYTRFLATKDRRFLNYALKAADWMVAVQKPDGSWRYGFPYQGLKAGWTSGMAQGLGISLLTRMYLETGRTAYLNAAWESYHYMMMPVASGGTLTKMPDGSPLLQEYAGNGGSNRVLNGAIYGLWGVRDLWVVTGDADVNRDWRQLASTIARYLPAWDLGYWSCYNAWARKDATWQYHRLHVAQLSVLGVQTSDSRLVNAGNRFFRYLVARSQ